MSGDGPERSRASEALLFALLPEAKIGPQARVWCVSPGRGQLAVEAARASPERQVVVSFVDAFLADAAREAAGGREGTAPPNLTVDCAADFPKGPFDAALMPLRAGADSELAWEMLQHAYVELNVGGTLIASVDERRDHWVAGRMEALFGTRFTRHKADDAIAYIGIKRDPLKKVKTFDCEFAFRDRERLVRAVSRPAVFSHRRLDLGARAVLESLSWTEENGLERDYLENGMRVLDYGCGSGTVGIACALRSKDVKVHFVDSMPRAVACALRGAEMNGITGCTGAVCFDGQLDVGNFDLALLNPPYYSHFRIAEVFVLAARGGLRRGGRVHIVTKQPEWFLERLPRDFDKVSTRMLRTYDVVCGVKR